jgi:hypothetical protein
MSSSGPEETERLHTPLTRADIELLCRGLFPQGFTFDSTRQIFDGWLTQIGKNYSEKERQAMWIGFAHRVCELYYEDPS